MYLIKKLFQTSKTIRKPGEYGHQCWAAGPSNCVPAFVWADGSQQQQLTEYGTQQLTEYAKWWPCIVLVCDGKVWPFYCPALAWQRARPWGVHPSRVRRREFEILPPAMPSIVDSSAAAAAPTAGGRASSDAENAENEDGARSGTRATARRNRWTRARKAPTCSRSSSPSSSWQEVDDIDA